MSMSVEGTRTFKVAATSVLDATYKVAIEYSLKHVLEPTAPKEGEQMFEVSITAVPVKR